MLRPLGKTGLEIAPLVLGGNVFGWTVDERQAFSLLDGFVDAGLNAIDTADSYSTWVEGHKGGESETIIGKWLKANPGKRDKVLLFTKVGSDLGDGKKGLSARWIAQAAEDSLRRLQTDVIDLYQSHWPDPDTPVDETLTAYERLLRAGKVRAIGASNLDVAQLTKAWRWPVSSGCRPYGTLQPEYNLYERARFRGCTARAVHPGRARRNHVLQPGLRFSHRQISFHSGSGQESARRWHRQIPESARRPHRGGAGPGGRGE